VTAELVIVATSFALGYWRGRRARKPQTCPHGGPAVAGARCLKCVAEKIERARR
jgi:hypothetical protein